MRRVSLMAAVALTMLVAASSIQAQQISGDYVETRSADVYTGPCVANGEVGLVGDLAILGWRVKKGSWSGVNLAGLSVVGVVKAGATLGDTYSNPYPAKAVMIVDERANENQRAALLSFARLMGGDLLKDVVRVEIAPIKLDVNHSSGHYGTVVLKAGDIAGVETRMIGDKDHLCGNEVAFYPPLTETTHSMPAVAELDKYTGPGLGVSWTSHGRRSAFVGSFAR